MHLPTMYSRTTAAGPFRQRVELPETEERELPNGKKIQVPVTDWAEVTDSAKQAELVALYASVFGGETVDQLIAFDVIESSGAMKGIANYRSGGEHKQKRF